MNGKGWFKVPGIRPEGDRTIEEQLCGLGPALKKCIGKTVLDLGCAEGAIALEFARAGAAWVMGIELLQTHLDIARRLCKGVKAVHFICANLKEWSEAHPEPERFDIVLCLGIAHKLHDPTAFMRWCARSTRGLLLFRGPGRAGLKSSAGVIHSKHGGAACNVPATLAAEGLTLEQHLNGVRGEGVQYWRRT